MGLGRVAKKGLKHLAQVLVAMLFVPLGGRCDREDVEEDRFDGRPIRCAICIGDERMADGFITGYSYEILRRFSGHIGSLSEINISDDLDTCLDSVLMDSLDIVVVPFGGGTMVGSREPRTPREDVSFSIPVDSTVLLVFKSSKSSQKSINRWIGTFNGSPSRDSLRTRFFRGYNPFRKVSKEKRLLSPYDDLFKKHSRTAGLDWRLIAALSWCESRFRIQTVSHRGARGLMQIVPRTAGRFGVECPLDPEQNIKAGAEYLAHLRDVFKYEASDEEELTKFVLAAYNAGEGRLWDCIKLSKALGTDHSRWDSLKRVIPKMGADSTILAEDLRHGSFKGVETLAFVDAVHKVHSRFRALCPESGDPPMPKDEERDVEEEDLGIFIGHLEAIFDGDGFPGPDSLSAPEGPDLDSLSSMTSVQELPDSLGGSE